MKVLIVDKAGDGLLDIAIRAMCDRHAVKYFLRDYDPRKRPVGKGLVDLVPDWRPWMRWADLVLCAGNDLYMTEMDRWSDQGAAIIGGGVESALWESDRAHGMWVFRRAGIPVPPYREFTDYDKAIAYVKRHDQAFVSKPSGHCDDKALSYVAKTPADLVYMLERWKRAGKRSGLEFVLQEKIDGIEAAVGGWFGPDGFAPGWEENFEEKKLMPGGLGPNTGEMGTVMRYVRSSKLADMVLRPLEPQLAAIGYVGNVDVNCIIDDEGQPWPLEFTMRFGYPAINIEMELFASDPIEFWAGLCDGKPPRAAHRMDQVAIGVVYVLPPFPHSHALGAEVIGVPLYGEVDDHIHPCEMMAGSAPHSEGGRVVERECLVTAGDYCLVATGSGDTVQKARSAAYRTVGKISMPRSPFYRNDIGAKLKKQLPDLQKHGFSMGMAYS